MRASVSMSDTWTEFITTRRPALREELITEYAPLARFVVGRLGIPPTSLLDAEDLISYGMIGLINAIDRYDPARGVRFEAFATPRIRGAVIDQLRSLNWLPRTAVARVRQIEQVLAELEQRLRRPAREEEAAAAMGVPLERYRQMLLEVSATVLSLDAPLSTLTQDDEATSLSDLLEDQSAMGPDLQVERGELVVLLGAAVDRLPEREKLLLSLYYHEELTMKEISKVMRVSESRVCQLHMQAIMRLRTVLKPYQSDDATDAQDSNSGLSTIENAGNSETGAHETRRSNHQKAIASSGKGRRSRHVIS
ncbi:MAG TPA: FliA/WhiG family RNA polymerase sigma factor [Ktedonobacteraceae bacterium]|nr:FliA/WhiG family RNA polymerase sigma factor [Ktedonobacteraceae bacterium]